MLEAIKSAHSECDGKKCKHEDALSKQFEAIRDRVKNMICAVLADRVTDRDITTIEAMMVTEVFRAHFALILVLWDNGFHTGYRLRELEQAKREVAELEKLTKG